jgi:hypothetical protein
MAEEFFIDAGLPPSFEILLRMPFVHLLFTP